MQEVIFLFGPPFSGKTSYYEQHLKTSHERVSASELYQANPSWGLRHFILHVLKLLGEGKGVVIDDENWSRKTRASCIQSIRAKVPACKFTCFVLKPKDAFGCLWRREWVLAQHFLSREENRPNCQSTPLVDLCDSEARIQMWFRHESGDHVSGIDDVEESEGWQQIKEIETSLQPKTNYKFEVPAAFLDWRSLVDHSIDDLAEALMTWKHNTVCGRVIVLATITDEVLNDKDSEDSNRGDIYESVLKKIKSKTQVLARKLSLPVFYVVINDHGQSGSFTRCPKPGILSFLQRLHHIDLQHSGTVYIHHFKGNRATDYAQTGLKQFAAGLVCRNPTVLAQCQGARTSSSPHESITDFDYIPESKGLIPSSVLFFNKIASDDNEDDVKGTYIAEERWGRVLGVSFKDTQTFQSFQADYAANASHISAEGSKMGQKPLQGVAKRGSSSLRIESSDPQSHQQDLSSDRAETSRMTKLPAWMTPKRRKSQEENKDDKAKTDNKYAGLPSTMYCMTVAELREVAKLFLDQDEDSDASSRSFPESSEFSESREMKDNEDVDQSYEDMNLEMEESDSEGERPGDEARNASREQGDDRDRRKERPECGGGGGGEDGVASIITDLFSGESGRKRPPPKKKAGRTPFTASSALLWSDESPWKPDTPCTTSKGTSHHEKEPNERQPPVQDFSFLDEIF